MSLISKSVGSALATHVANWRKVEPRSAAGIGSDCSPKGVFCRVDQSGTSSGWYMDDPMVGWRRERGKDPSTGVTSTGARRRAVSREKPGAIVDRVRKGAGVAVPVMQLARGTPHHSPDACD